MRSGAGGAGTGPAVGGGGTTGSAQAGARETGIPVRSAAATHRRPRERAERRASRRLRRAIARYGGCLQLLPPRQRRILTLRAGIGPAEPASRSRVARRLDLTPAVVRRAERRGLRALQSAGREGCASAGTSRAAGAVAVRSASSLPVPATSVAGARRAADGGTQGGDSGSGGGGAEQGGERSRQGAGGGVAGISATRPAPRSGALDGIGLLLPFLLALLAGLAVLYARRRGESSPWAGWVAPLLPVATAAVAMPERERSRPRPAAAPAGGPPRPPRSPAPSRVRPPDPHRPWAAELQRGETSFGVVARAAADESGVVLATSRSAEDLEAALLAAGWQPLPQGASGVKRFAWVVASPPRCEVQRPVEAGARWRCEIKWHGGYRRSSFRAVMYGPARRRGSTLGRSDTFEWLMMGDPEPRDERQVTEVRRLAERLRAAGWEPAGRGPRWYSLRFAWPHEEPPPERLAPAPEDVQDPAS